MSLIQFKADVRRYRGTLANMDIYLKDIYYDGIPELKDLCMSKQMGIKYISKLTNLSYEQQFELYDWLKQYNFKSKKREIDLKLQEIINEFR